MSQKALIYCRVSSLTQEKEGHGLTSQETRCCDYAKQQGYEVAAVFPDTITGGGDFMKRPGMVALLSFLDAQPDEKFVVIFDDPKRFARSTRFHLELREAFRQRGARIECLNFKFDESPEGEFIETIIAAQGQLERKQNSRQVAQKMKARMQNGYWIHNPPIGYRYETVKGHGKLLVPNPPFDAIVKEAFAGYASGRFSSQAEVKRFLEEFPNFPRNKHGLVRQQRVTDMLTQPVYTGHICSERYGINWLKGQHDGLISMEIYERVQERRSGKAKAPKRADLGETFALRGMIECACCGAPLRSSISRGNGGHYPYYLCQTKGCEAYGKSIKRDALENEVGTLVQALQPSQGLLALATAMFQAAWSARTSQAETIREEARRQLKALDAQIDTLLDRIVEATNARVISAYESKIAKLERDRAAIVEQSANQAEPKGSFEEQLEPVLTFLASPWKLWETGSVHLRRVVLKLAFTNPIKYCRNKGARTPNLAFPFKALEGFSHREVCFGADGGTRTHTGVTPQRPQRCASTNSATTAHDQVGARRIRNRRRLVKRKIQGGRRVKPTFPAVV